ncbi:cyclophilin family peptidyl-prolyl cis-trans isomerase, RRM-containing Rct1 [Schizosaccharomyces pombe]|uniref:Peptidyl-prolyl cis-trans isomerase cyp6 n=1 Tax=Schizosaccharomyces pombe (strain 972 / ATCC 24843) TaxID=284812 RepID=PPIL4_SCHPO|nr:RRM-containing cyclophilin Rct1 [Schizosaccharomyces pombe]Q9UUE4.1 RecName: Full=Peptidyl-prolyl cis-trans isomerase cyp6; Short=PPIase cyp6; AltName: Full=Rotamase cyp6 [Schizosaccharomyces pombe 972h-]CAB52803.1 RRM-containing cyclophilin regulating transcription Rct1 [Schizosaccharomyces pombe]|eukprot:NP_595894.1 RRM-containing cyclophilin Rct1 [Schizosaccharomyces pombe]
MSVLIETTVGDLVIDLFVKEAPKTCENFLKLCKLKYYNFCPFYNIQHNYTCQTGDPLGPTGDGGRCVWNVLNKGTRFFKAEFNPSLVHNKMGLVSMSTATISSRDDKLLVCGSQFIITLSDNLEGLDERYPIYGQVAEGFDTLLKINDAICDEEGQPYRDIRIKHTIILDDPFEDPPDLVEPLRSPSPTPEQLATVRIGENEQIESETSEDKLQREKEMEAEAEAVTLEMIGDLPFAHVAPPENVLFVCKLNPVTQDEDLELIFSRFGKIISCQVIRDKETGDSLQYAFIEFDNKESVEKAYFKMQNVLIDDSRIHVDFSQSVARYRQYYNSNRDRKRSSSRSDDREYHRRSDGRYDRSNYRDDYRHRRKERDHRDDQSSFRNERFSNYYGDDRSYHKRRNTGNKNCDDHLRDKSPERRYRYDRRYRDDRYR